MIEYDYYIVVPKWNNYRVIKEEGIALSGTEIWNIIHRISDESVEFLNVITINWSDAGYNIFDDNAYETLKVDYEDITRVVMLRELSK